MSRNRKLFYQQKFLVGKNIAIFLTKAFPSRRKKEEKREAKCKEEK